MLPGPFHGSKSWAVWSWVTGFSAREGLLALSASFFLGPHRTHILCRSHQTYMHTHTHMPLIQGSAHPPSHFTSPSPHPALYYSSPPGQGSLSFLFLSLPCPAPHGAVPPQRLSIRESIKVCWLQPREPVHIPWCLGGQEWGTRPWAGSWRWARGGNHRWS